MIVAYRWVILAVGAVAQGAFAVVFAGLPVIAPAIRETYGLSLEQIGFVLAAVNLGTIITVLPWGLLADRIGERLVVAVGIAGCGAAIAWAAATSSYAMLLASTTVAGLAGASVLSATGRAVMAWFPHEQRGLAFAIRQTATPAGGALAAVVLPLFVHAGGVRAALFAIAGVCLTAGVAALALLRGAPGAAGAIAAARGGHPFADRVLWRLSLGSGLLVASQAAILGFVVLYLHEERALSLGAAGAVLAVTNTLGAVLRLGSGIRADRTGLRLRPLYRLGCALTASLAAATVLTSAPLVALVPALVAAGALSLSWNALSYTATAELAGEGRAGTALGFQQTVLSIAVTVAPVAFAALVEHSSWETGFLAATVTAGSGALLLGRLRERR